MEILNSLAYKMLDKNIIQQKELFIQFCFISKD